MKAWIYAVFSLFQVYDKGRAVYVRPGTFTLFLKAFFFRNAIGVPPIHHTKISTTEQKT